jgi:hypothetical protein
MSIHVGEINRRDLLTAWAEHLQPPIAGNQGGSDGRREPHRPTGGKAFIPTFNYPGGIITSGLVGALPPQISSDIVAARAYAHGWCSRFPRRWFVAGPIGGIIWTRYGPP